VTGKERRETPGWCALKVRVDCPECGSALFIDGPYKNVVCTACRSRTSVTNLWPRLLENAIERGGTGQHFRALSLVWAGNQVPHILYGANKGHPPICSECGHVITAADEIADGTDGQFFCPGCGLGHPTWAAPGYLAQTKLPGGKRAKQIFMAPAESAEPPPAAPGAPEVRPVLFGCLNCGANLRITVDTPRVLTCEYCDTDCFLPPAVWHRLHPVRKRRAFWIRLG
jgi:DNA-directed RNA polymerase subunit RPC12/RpoP